MPFTDDDKKRLKEYLDLRKGEEPSVIYKAGALLARLDAAERVMRAEHNDDNGTVSMCIQPCELCDAMKAWCKAAGKDSQDTQEPSTVLPGSVDK